MGIVHPGSSIENPLPSLDPLLLQTLLGSAGLVSSVMGNEQIVGVKNSTNSDRIAVTRVPELFLF